MRRFENEATAIARLRHPNIVQVYDLNHDGDLYYMVLEYLSGETLQKRIKRMNEAGDYIPLREALQYTSEVCKASDYAHHRGMVHRDIKPANVMLDLNGSAILMDFGIARIIEGQQQHTATGAVLGTALYMSPEQIQGLHPDARSDIYSIGVTLFEVLGGRPPFEANSMMTLMLMHLNDPPPDLEKLHPGIPVQVRAIVNRALEKDPANRFQTCAEMAAALQRALDMLSVGKTAAPTVIETTPQPQPLKTIIEPVPPAPSRAASSATFVEPGAGRPPEPAPWAAPVPPARPASRKKTIAWVVAVVAVVLALALAGGGFILYNQVIPLLTSSPTGVAGLAPDMQATQAMVGPTETAAAAAANAPAETLEPSPPPAPSPAATELPAPTEKAELILPTATVEILPTATLAPPAAPVIGGADKIAYLFENNIWTANVDGSDMQQVTTDGSVKNYLRWLPDGQGFSYISGKCIETAGLDGNGAPVTCFNNSTYLDSFEVSPDGTRVALSLDRQLYLLPFNLERLAQANSHPDLVAMADCPALAPYQRNMATSARWSKDGKLLAAVTLGVLDNNVRGDVVQVFAVDQCIPNPLVQVQFPPPHF